MTIENDDVYTIGFDREEITLREGASADVRLSISPTPSTGAITVALSVSDDTQLSVSPEEFVFSATSASANIVISVTADDDEEEEERYIVRLGLTDDNNFSTNLSPDRLGVTVPAQGGGIRIKIRVYLEGALP